MIAEPVSNAGIIAVGAWVAIVFVIAFIFFTRDKKE